VDMVQQLSNQTDVSGNTGQLAHFNLNFSFLFFYRGKLCLVSGVFVMLHCT